MGERDWGREAELRRKALKPRIEKLQKELETSNGLRKLWIQAQLFGLAKQYEDPV